VIIVATCLHVALPARFILAFVSRS